MGKLKVKNDTVVTNNTKRISALKKYVTNSKTEIPVGGETLKPAAVIAVFQDSLDTRAAVTATQAGYKSALAARLAAEEKRIVADDALKGWVLNTFGANSAEAGEFGYAPRKAPVVSAADRANAVLLAKATRKARGTMGPKAKLSIKGTLVAPTAPAAPANSAAAAAVVPSIVAPVATPVVHAAPASTAVPAPTPVAAAPAAAPAVNAPAAGGSA
jgi:hypothetical protein